MCGFARLTCEAAIFTQSKMIKILSDNEITTSEWDELEERAWTSSFFQTKSCYDLYGELPFVDGFVVAVREQEKLMGLCCGYLTAEKGRVKAFFSRRAIIPGGLLLDKNISSEAIKALLQELKKKLSEKVGEERMIRSRLPRQEIAKMIGASREMVSRVMKGLETEGYIVPLPEGKVLLREKLSSYLA